MVVLGQNRHFFLALIIPSKVKYNLDRGFGEINQYISNMSSHLEQL